MSSTAYIKLVPASIKQTITMEELKEMLEYYKEITTKTGEQLSWPYSQAAFPYEIKEEINNHKTVLCLAATQDRYHSIWLSIEQSQAVNTNTDEAPQTYIQLLLSNRSTHGDKGKANELSKFLAKKLQGELQLFNGRVMYYYKRK
ncbi:DUF1885 family protein [Bacillus tuaregi]|uniref:DUF1885 family protein n=1 Tax=Bacillus tuaregi TaxID=1816695 RepID=UPI0009FDB6E5|nr:DUF1885 family protein [Bacillus tuaregi]